MVEKKNNVRAIRTKNSSEKLLAMSIKTGNANKQ